MYYGTWALYLISFN